jgi:hypothetical protein
MAIGWVEAEDGRTEELEEERKRMSPNDPTY